MTDFVIAYLDKRKEEGIHPCMMEALISYVENQELTSLWYDGNHIITYIDEMTRHYLPLYSYGYKHLCKSFQDLNDFEKLLLQDYFLMIKSSYGKLCNNK